MRRPLRIILVWPLALALASLGGLILGLVGDGLPDVASWLLLGTLPLIIALAWLRRDRPIERNESKLYESRVCTLARIRDCRGACHPGNGSG